MNSASNCSNSYSNLKKAIYSLEQDQTAALPALSQGPDAEGDDIEQESAALLASSTSDCDSTFVPLLDKELRKVVSFYGLKESELRKVYEGLIEDIKRAESEDAFDEDVFLDDDDADGSDAENGDAIDSAPTTVRGTRTARNRRGSMEQLFSDPHRYNEASRDERGLTGSSSRPNVSKGRSSRNLFDASEVGLPDNEPADSAVQPSPRSVRQRRLSQSLTDEDRLFVRNRKSSITGQIPQRLNTLFKRRPSVRKTLGLVSAASNGAEQSGEAPRIIGDSEAGSESMFENKSQSIWTAENDWAIDMRITYKKRVADLYVEMSELKQFVQLNETGMKKILKKYDKIIKSDLKSRYFDGVALQQYPFKEDTRATLEDYIRELVSLYAKVVTGGDIPMAMSQLKAQLREQVVWQRNTVWREMIGIERRAQGASLEQTFMKNTGDGEKPKPTQIGTPCGTLVLPPWLGISTVQLLCAFTLLVLLLKVPGMRFFSRIEEQNCLAMLVFCTILWATEVIPLFVTSLMVPLLVVILRVARTDDIEDRRMSASETTKWIFSQMFAPNMALLLGGFTLAAALSKYSIDKLLAQKVLRYAGSRPAFVLLAHMGVACFASMWISNVAAPVLMYSLIQPILRNLPTNTPFAPAMIMGIALASNIGGQTSPIASPQNLIALQYMEEPLGWLQWFAITIPVSGLSLLVIWMLLLWSYGSGRGVVIKKMSENNDRFTGIQYFISAVALGTIVLWCLERNFEYVLGDMGVIAIIPMVLFFGTGILTKEDFNNFLWTIVFLAMGGIALGKAVTSSGLLASLDDVIQELVKGMPVWKVLLSLLSISLVVATFIVS